MNSSNPRSQHNQDTFRFCRLCFSSSNNHSVIRILPDNETLELSKPMPIEDRCDNCTNETMRARSYNTPVNSCRHSVDFVHSDKWGPYTDRPVMTPNLPSFFYTAIVDSDIFFQRKSETSTCFEAFKARHKVQRHTYPLCQNKRERRRIQLRFDDYRKEQNIELKLIILNAQLPLAKPNDSNTSLIKARNESIFREP